MLKRFFILIQIILLGSSFLKGQTLNKIRYSVASQAYIEGAVLGEKDTVNPDIADRGYFITDIGMHVDPSKSTSVSAVMRLNQNYSGGGLFGAIEFRQITLRGVFGNNTFYTVGDFDYAMTPYTVFVPDEEGLYTGGRWIQTTHKLNKYNNQLFGNQRRMRGVRLSQKINLKKVPLIESIEADAFLSRSRISASAQDTLADLMNGVARLTINQSKKLKINLNSANTFTFARTQNSAKLSNNIYGGDFKLDLGTGIWKYGFTGEVAISRLGYDNDAAAPTEPIKDWSSDIGIFLNTTKETFAIEAHYMQVGPRFYSIAAQSKSIDFTRDPILFPTVTNREIQRRISLFDLSRDGSIYTPRLSESLMAYNPVYANAMPYGIATPNRTGFRVKAKLKDYLEKFEVRAEGASLKEIDPTLFGYQNAESFLLAKGKVELNINNFIQWSKLIKIGFGGQIENSARADGPNGDEKAQLKTTILSSDFDIEFLKKLHLVGGIMYLKSEGNERLTQYDEYNNPVFNNDNLNVNESQGIYSAGLEYRYNELIYIILNYNKFRFTDNGPINNNTHEMDHLSILFNLNF